MKVLAIIPARGGSKSIPLKNIQKVGRKPLIVHTINAALNSKKISRIIVSTDNEKIRKIALKAGAEVPFLRPKKIGKDTTPTVEVVKHVLKFLSSKESYIPEIITSLIPPNPFRTSKMIDRSINLLRNSNASCVVGVSRIKTHPYRSFWKKGKYLKPMNENFLRFYQRQTYPTCFYPNGSIFTFWGKTLKKYNNIYGPKILPLESKKSEIIVDVDDWFDLFVCEMKMLYWDKFRKLRIDETK